MRSEWGVNPLELFVKLNSTGSVKREISSENRITDRENNNKLLEVFRNISEELKAEIGNSFMKMLTDSCKELIYTEKREENKTYIYVTFDF